MAEPIPPFDRRRIVHIRQVDHPESVSVGPRGEVYTTGTGHQVYRVDLATNTATVFATTPNRCLGQAVDAGGNLYCVDCVANTVLRVTPGGTVSTYATGPQDRAMLCANYPAFDRAGRIYLSDSGDWSDTPNGAIYRVPRGGGRAQVWHPGPLDTPNAIALDAEEGWLYLVETFGESIARIQVLPDGSAGPFERVVHLPRHVPDGIALDTEGRIWIALHRPDAICVYDPQTRKVATVVDDWRGEQLRGPTDLAFAGPRRDILIAASLDNLVLHRLDGVGATGLPLAHPRIE